MNNSWVLAWLLAGFWGISWAVFLQFAPLGKWLAMRRTWITVVVGVAGTLVTALPAVDIPTALQFGGLFVASSAGIIIRSLYNEWRDEHA